MVGETLKRRGHHYGDRYIVLNGEKYSYHRVGEMLGISPQAVAKRVVRGWTAHEILTTKSGEKPKRDEPSGTTRGPGPVEAITMDWLPSQFRRRVYLRARARNEPRDQTKI